MNSTGSVSAFFMIIVTSALAGCSSSTETDRVGTLAKNEIATTQTVASIEEEPKQRVPNDFPADIFIADTATVQKFTSSGGKHNLVLEYFESDQDSMIKTYFEGMAEMGWSKVASSELPIGTITNFTKSDRKCTISISSLKDQTITVAIIF